jgi:hypothetical protein
VVLRCTGGRKQLCELVDEHGKELRADFQQFYGLDLADAWRGRLTATRVLDLAEQLHAVPDSRYRAAAAGDPSFVGWNQAAAVAADQYEMSQLVAGVKREHVLEYPRPSVKAKKPKSFDDFDIFAAVQQSS